MVVTGSESPIVVVLSGSMEPAFQVTHSSSSSRTSSSSASSSHTPTLPSIPPPSPEGEGVEWRSSLSDELLLLLRHPLLLPLQRGDLLFLTNYEEEEIRVGEIVVFKIDGRDIPIVHRCLILLLFLLFFL